MPRDQPIQLILDHSYLLRKHQRDQSGRNEQGANQRRRRLSEGGNDRGNKRRDHTKKDEVRHSTLHVVA